MRTRKTDQIFFEDILPGTELPPLTREIAYGHLVAYAAASRDLYAIHLNPDVARASGLPGVIVHGALKAAVLGQLLTHWMGEFGTLRSLDVEFRGIDVPGRITARGVIVQTSMRDGRALVECDIWIENAAGTRTTTGRAEVLLPTRRTEREIGEGDARGLFD